MLAARQGGRRSAPPVGVFETGSALQSDGMPFKSQAQRRKFAQLLVEGKISPQTFEEWNRETGAKKLPDHVKRKKKRGSSTARKRAKRR